VDTELRVHLDEKVNMVGHHLDLNDIKWVSPATSRTISFNRASTAPTNTLRRYLGQKTTW
jgi:hypothetical protein